jgi:acetyl esterase/lipase
MAQQTIPLYPGSIPNSKSTPDEEYSEQKDGISIVYKISRPTLSIFLAPKKKANGTAVIIVPGGGYWVNASSHEGTDVARKFNEMGVTAFVLKYRIPNDATMENREIGPLQDAQQALKVVRERAAEWHVDTARIGIMGFSAGGHLAACAGTHFAAPVIPDAGGTNLRPDFMILIYPVISFQDSVGHIGSRDQLLGKTPSSEKKNYYSNELQVTAQTPPTFLVHAGDDTVVIPENSIRFYQSLLRNQVPAEMHLYPKGGHGFGMNNPTTGDRWMDRCQNWMRAGGWLR